MLVYNKASGPLRGSTSPVFVHVGYDGWWLKVRLGQGAAAVPVQPVQLQACACIAAAQCFAVAPLLNVPAQCSLSMQDKRVIAMQPLSDAQVQKYRLPAGQWVGAEVSTSG